MNHGMFTVIQWSFIAVGLVFLAGSVTAIGNAGFVFAAIGLVLAGIGGAIGYYRWWSAKKAAHLLENGHLLQAQFLRVEMDESLKVNNAHPYRIVAQWHDEGENRTHIFRSASIWFDPAPYITAATIPVYMDPLKPSYYFMDVSFLPKRKG